MNDRTQPFHTETVLCAFHHLIPQLLLSAVLSTSLCLHAQVDCLMNAGNFTTTESWGDGLLVLTAGNEALTFPQENSGFSAFPFGVRNLECGCRALHGLVTLGNLTLCKSIYRM